MRFRRCGDLGVLIEVDGPVLSFLTAAGEADLTGVQDMVPGDRTLLVVATTAAALDLAIARLRSLAPSTRPAAAADELVVRVTYDGPDLGVVAAAWQVGVDDVARRLAEATWTVAFTGFAPGFGYLRTDADWPAVPRRESPRTRVPAGSVALAGGYAGIYPRDSPGGWQVIGSTRLDLFDADRDPPALLWPGRSVRFEGADPA